MTYEIVYHKRLYHIRKVWVGRNLFGQLQKQWRWFLDEYPTKEEAERALQNHIEYNKLEVIKTVEVK